MIQDISNYGVFWLALLLTPTAANACSFNYEYLQVDAGNSITTMNSMAGNMDFGGTLLSLNIQMIPAHNFYLRTSTMQTHFNDNNTSKGVRLNLKGAETSYIGVAGWIFPTIYGFDVRAGAGAILNERDYSFSGGGINSQIRDKQTRITGEAGLKFAVPVLGEVDLIYNRLGETNYFTYENTIPLFMDVAFSSGYTYSPKAENHSGSFSWNFGLRAYF